MKWFATLLSLLFIGCNTPVVIDNNPSYKTLVITVGGLEKSQLNDLEAQIDKLPVKLISAGKINGYKDDISILIAQEKYDRLVLIGHSLGSGTVFNFAQKNKVDYLVLIDPVGVEGDSIPSNVVQYDILYRSQWFGFITTKFPNNHSTIIKGGHNTICHNKDLISLITSKI